MGPSVAYPPQGGWVWLRRKDSNLQSPDPESGGLPISRLLSAGKNIAKHPVSRHHDAPQKLESRLTVFATLPRNRSERGAQAVPAGPCHLPAYCRSRPCAALGKSDP